MAATTITLASGATTITLDTPDFPEEWSPDLDQWRSQALGGAIWSITRSTAVVKTPVLHWALMTAAQHTSLETFINTTVVGSTTVFTFTDWDSTAWNAQYLGGIKEAKSNDYDQWVVDLQLRVSTP